MIRALLSLCIALTLSACDLFEDIGDRLTSTGQGVSLLTRTPALADAQDLDPDLEAALPLDTLDANVTGVLVAMGERDDPLSTEEPTPVVGATVTVEFGGTTVTLCDGPEDGTYIATSLAEDECGDVALAYEPDETYVTDIVVEDHTGTVSIVAPDGIDVTNVDFDPALAPASNFGNVTLKSHPADTALNVDWSSDPNAGKPTFLSVFRIRYTGPAGGMLNADNWTADQEPVFDNRPTTPGEIIGLVLGNSPSELEIPGSVFDAQALYFVVLTRAEMSTDTDGLALGSGAMAGLGTAFAFWVD